MGMQINPLGLAVPEGDTHHTVWVQKTKKLDHDNFLMPLLRPFLRRHAVDIGAHIGTHAIYYANHSEFVTCFEPHPLAFECLTHNLRKFRNVTLHNTALGDHSTTVGVIECPGNLGATQTTDDGDIPCTTLDSFKLDCDFIKIDAEGDEIRILVGAAGTIQRCRPVMCIEQNSHMLAKRGLTVADLTQTITHLGYSYRMIHPRQDPIQCDLICTPFPRMAE